MKKVNICVWIIGLSMVFLFSCNRDQYNGFHLQSSKQKVLKDEYNNYHVKETRKALEKNENKKEKKNKCAERNRLANLKAQVKSNDYRKYKRNSLEFDYY